MALDPSNLSAREGLVWTYLKSGARERASAEADERLALSPDVAWRKQWINVVMALPARRVAALAAARALVRERPADAEVHVILGRVLSGQSDGFHDAAEAYQAALRLAPRDVAIRIELARVLVWSARYAEAIAEYRRVIAVAPDDVVQEELAGALVTGGRYAEAVAEYREVVARRPQDRELRRALGRALSSANHSAEAIKIFDDLVAENPADAEALRERAFIARWDGDFETARRLLRQAAAIRPGDPQIQGELESVTLRAAALTAARRDLTVPLLCALTRASPWSSARCAARCACERISESCCSPPSSSGPASAGSTSRNGSEGVETARASAMTRRPQCPLARSGTLDCHWAPW